MRFHQPYNTILDRPAKVRILRFFCRKGGEWTGRRVAAELDMNPVTAHAALRKLHQATLLTFRKVGTHYLYALRTEHYLVQRALRPLFRHEARARVHLQQVLHNGLTARQRTMIVSVALYGSVVRGHERPTSDVDILLLVTSAAAKHEVHQALDRMWDTLTRTFGNPLAPYINTVAEARQKYRRQLPVMHEILRAHELLWGQPLEEVLRGRTP